MGRISYKVSLIAQSRFSININWFFFFSPQKNMLSLVFFPSITVRFTYAILAALLLVGQKPHFFAKQLLSTATYEHLSVRSSQNSSTSHTGRNCYIIKTIVSVHKVLAQHPSVKYYYLVSSGPAHDYSYFLLKTRFHVLVLTSLKMWLFLHYILVKIRKGIILTIHILTLYLGICEAEVIPFIQADVFIL